MNEESPVVLTLQDIRDALESGNARAKIIEHAEKTLVSEALIKARGNQTTAMQMLHINRGTLRNKIKKYDLDWVMKMTTEKQNYKIKVANEAESREVQELFFELGYEWGFGGKIIQDAANTIYAIFGIMQLKGQFYTNEENIVFQELTLPQLRDLVVLHRNDVGDATHESDFVGHKFFVSSENKAYEFRENKWQPKICKSLLEPIVKQEPKMTWQDAFRALSDEKEVEGFSGKSWINLKKITVECIKEAKDFRLAPQRKTINGNFTKEELLKIAEEMV